MVLDVSSVESDALEEGIGGQEAGVNDPYAFGAVELVYSAKYELHEIDHPAPISASPRTTERMN